MTLRDLMASNAKGPLTRLDLMGELVTYVFATGSTRTVRAIVDRLGAEPSAGNVPQVAKLVAHVSIPVDTTVGIAGFARGDKIIVAMRLGTAPVTAKVRAVLSRDEGFIRLEVVA